MKLKVATTFREILDGWRLVYKQYLKSALINVNPFAVFTYPQYISRNAAVILGKEGDKNVCSISAVLDSSDGLPLDACFREELDNLREQNKKLIEIGLLSNISEKASPFYLIELLSSIARFGVYSNCHDYVIGVHPRRAKFFKQSFGFNQIGEAKPYAKLLEAKVVLLYADGQHFETMAQKASHAVYHEDSTLEFDHRYQFARMASMRPFVIFDDILSFFRGVWRTYYPGANKQNHRAIISIISVNEGRGVNMTLTEAGTA